MIIDRTTFWSVSWLFHAEVSSSKVDFWDSRPEFAMFDDLPPDSDFVDEQALFCPPSIPCFDLVTQDQYMVAISCLRCVKWNKAALDQLVLPEDKKETICCMLQNHGNTAVKQLSNLIPGKGAV